MNPRLLLWGMLFFLVVGILGAYLVLVIYLVAVLGSGYMIMAIGLGFLSGILGAAIGYSPHSTGIARRRRVAVSNAIMERNLTRLKQQYLSLDVIDFSEGMRRLSESTTPPEVLEENHNGASVQDMTSCIKIPMKVDDDHVEEPQQQLPVDVRQEQSPVDIRQEQQQFPVNVNDSAEETECLSERNTFPEVLKEKHNEASVQEMTSCIKNQMKVDDDHVDEPQQQLPVDVRQEQSPVEVTQEQPQFPVNVHDFFEETECLSESNTSTEVLGEKHNEASVQDMMSCVKKPTKVDNDHVEEPQQQLPVDIRQEQQQFPVNVNDFSEETECLSERNTSPEVLEEKHNKASVQDMMSSMKKPMNVDDDHVEEPQQLPVDVRQEQQFPVNVTDFSEETELLSESNTSLEVPEHDRGNSSVQDMTLSLEESIEVDVYNIHDQAEEKKRSRKKRKQEKRRRKRLEAQEKTSNKKRRRRRR